MARYSHGYQVDRPLVLERGGQNYFYQTDHLGSVRTLTDASGTVINSYDYESYGRFETRIEGIVQPYAFTAREFDEESNYYYYRSRYYDPFSGRFVSADPLGFSAGDLNLYRYVFNNPTNRVDPYGLFSDPKGQYTGLALNTIRQAPRLNALGATVNLLFGLTLKGLAIALDVAQGDDDDNVIPFPVPKPPPGDGDEPPKSPPPDHGPKDTCKASQISLLNIRNEVIRQFFKSRGFPEIRTEAFLIAWRLNVDAFNRQANKHNKYICPDRRYYVPTLPIPPVL